MPRAVQHQPRRLPRRALLRDLSLGLVGLTLVACGSRRGGVTAPATDRPLQDFSARFAQYPAADAPDGDPARVVWPPFVTRADPEVQRLYEFQIRNGALMKYMPCFCGCHEEDGHRNNRDCYVEAINPDGSIVLDSMAPT